MMVFVGILVSSSIIPLSFAATLTNEIVEPSNNLFGLESHYVVGFTTATMGTIKTITVTFPTGFSLTNAKIILSSGIGPGTISVTGQTLNYTVSSAISVPLGRNIIIDFGKIVNNVVLSNTASVTTRDSLNAIIDGPTTSPAFTLTSVSSTMLGTNAVTNTKIANGAVTNTKILNNSINSTQITDGTIVNADLSSTAAIALAKLASGTLSAGIRVNSANIIDGSITGADMASGVALTGSASIDSPTLSVDSVNNRVGIGTTSPLGTLDVMGDLLIGNNPSRGFPGGNSLYLTNDLGDSHNSFRLDAAADNLYIVADSAPGAATGAGIIFRTAGAGGGESDRMTIDSSGNVGIGTLTPQTALDVYGIIRTPQIKAQYITVEGNLIEMTGEDLNCYYIDISNGNLRVLFYHQGKCS